MLIMVTKTQFIDIITALDEQTQQDLKCANAIQTVFEDANCALYNNSFLYNSIVKFLVETMNDKYEWIEYFIHELDYGRKYTDGTIKEQDGSIIRMSTADELYDFLIPQKLKVHELSDEQLIELGKMRYLRNELFEPPLGEEDEFVQFTIETKNERYVSFLVETEHFQAESFMFVFDRFYVDEIAYLIENNVKF